MNFWSHTLKRYVEIVTWLLLYHYLFIVYSGYVITGQASSVHKRAPHITEVTIQIRRHASKLSSPVKCHCDVLTSQGKVCSTVFKGSRGGMEMVVVVGGEDHGSGGRRQRGGGGTEQPSANNIGERGYPPGVLCCNMYA